MAGEVYINRLSKFFPNDPISNDDMESWLGLIYNTESRAKALVLRRNGINNRYYALDKNGKATHSNTQITAEAIKGIFDDDFTLQDMELLACGTTSPDQLLPSHASMVHGALKGNPIEVISPSGSCCSGMSAMKYAYLSVKSGSTNNSICSGSEIISQWMVSKLFNKEAEKLKELNERPIVAFEKEFLRWMLSDGAGAALLEKEPRGDISLRIDWIDILSFANNLDACMYAGAGKLENGELKGWKSYEPDEWLSESVFSMQQDVKLLDKNITAVGVQMLKDITVSKNFDVNSIDHFLPHISSEYFRQQIKDGLAVEGISISSEKWFTNLHKVGNVGSASIYLMLEELVHSGDLKKGQRILLMVPESARFTYAYALLTVC
ncbi:MAG: hypothetical protein COB85_09005 [Bacteroidetes bacterium]|nr:MAG: hypothetical protein COB85_09005 [Bacteroidota bacterium]